MIFLNSDYLIFMLIPALLLLYLIVTNKNKLDLVFSEEVLKKIKYDNGGLGRIGRNIMLSLASLFMIIALARPAVEKGEVWVENKRVEMFAALDISDSMKAKDLYPNRLDFAKEKFFRFLDLFPQADVGVLAFSSDIFMISPRTEDFSVIKYLVKNLSTDSISTKGTNFLLPIEAAGKFLKDSPSKILLLFTDGGDKKDFSKEIKEALKYNLSVYVYGVGTKEGDYIKVGDRKVLVRLNENIKDLAIKTKGAFIKGDYGDKDLELLIEDIKKRYLLDIKRNKKVRDFKELFYYPLSLAILFLLFAFSSLPSKSKIALFVFLIFYQTPSFSKIYDFWNIRKGIESYSRGDYYKSVYYFEKVAKSKNSPQSYYDLANAYYKQKSYKKAIENYEKVITEDKQLNFLRYYNEGNAYFKLRDFDNAIKMYEKARKFGEDEDLLYNLELAKKMKKLKKKQQSQPKKGKKKTKNSQSKKNSNKGAKNKKGDQKSLSKTDKKKSLKNKKSSLKKIKKSLTDMEEKKWQRLLEKKRAKTLPIKIKTDIKRSYEENPW